LKNKLIYAAGVLFILVLWKIASVTVGAELLVPSPEAVLTKLAALVSDTRFLAALVGTLRRLITALLVSIPLGLIAGLAAGLSPCAEAFLRPLFSVISATPVMSIILIAFLWFGAEKTPPFAAFLMVFPVVTSNVIAGVRAIDPKLAEMFALYKMNKREKLTLLYLPTLAPFLTAGVRASIAMAWKVVIAAEVLVQPLRALGTGMQRAKAALDTTDLFAWTLAAIICAAMSEGAFKLLAARGGLAGNRDEG
jgi:NitT/TauT family transport system permease protein